MSLHVVWPPAPRGRRSALAPPRPARYSGGVRSPHDELPDVRDGLTRAERVVLHVLAELERERGPRPVATAELYGRVVEYIPMSTAQLQAILARLGGARARA